MRIHPTAILPVRRSRHFDKHPHRPLLRKSLQEDDNEPNTDPGQDREHDEERETASPPLRPKTAQTPTNQRAGKRNLRRGKSVSAHGITTDSHAKTLFLAGLLTPD